MATAARWCWSRYCVRWLQVADADVSMRANFDTGQLVAANQRSATAFVSAMLPLLATRGGKLRLLERRVVEQRVVERVHPPGNMLILKP